jgi:hypothetical protein
MLVVTLETMKLDPMLCQYMTIDFTPLRQTHIDIHAFDEVWTNILLCISLQTCVPKEIEENWTPRTSDLKDHLPIIFTKGTRTPSKSTSNSPSTHVLVKHGIKIAIEQSPTPRAQLVKNQWPPIDYWGALTSSDPCEFSKKENYLLVVMFHSKLHNYLKAFSLKGWNHEVVQKMDSILKDKTWSLVDLPLGKKHDGSTN